MTYDSIKVICWGEILWDVFEDHSVIGGAPFNVAQRLHSLGINVLMVSTIGRDDLGQGIINEMQSKGLMTHGVTQNKTLATGRVNVTLDNRGVARYTIEDPAAWDQIVLSNRVTSGLQFADVLVFGSLAMRHRPNQIELEQLLLPGMFKVFDVNLRPPHFDEPWIRRMIDQVEMIKMNDEELDFLFAESLKFKPDHSIDDKCQLLSNDYPNKVWCVTLGADGARLFYKGAWYKHSGYFVEVVDTVGAGDSFLGALIYELILNEKPPDQALDAAARIGSIVAAKAGANPEISAHDQAVLIPKS